VVNELLDLDLGDLGLWAPPFPGPLPYLGDVIQSSATGPLYGRGGASLSTRIHGKCPPQGENEAAMVRLAFAG
jgi:hypothetical protein